MTAKSLKDESGQVLVLSLLSVMLLMAFLALAIDVGTLFRARRNMQIAADAAAVAGALDFKYNGSITSARAAGKAAALANGVTDASYVTIIQPTTGYHTSVGYIEADISQPNPTFFMRLFSFNSVNISTRAVAGTGANSACIWALAKSGTDVSLTGSGSITAQNCGIYDDSSASDALTLTGSGSVSAQSIGIVGSYKKTGSGSLHPSPPTTGIAPAADPLGLTTPNFTPSTSCSGSASVCKPSNTGSGSMTLNPGTYTSISNTGSGTLTLTPGNYTITGNLSNTGSGSLVLGAGNYTIGGNFTSSGSSSISIGSGTYTTGGNISLTGSGSLTGSSVTLISDGSTTITGSGSMSLTAPTSGPYNGVLVFEPSGDTSAVKLTGSGGAKLQGIVYAPSAPLTLTGSGSMNVSLDIIVDSLSVTGSGSITDTNYAAVTNTNTALSKLVMVE